MLPLLVFCAVGVLGEGVDWMLIPNGNGDLQVAILSDEPRNLKPVGSIKVLLYTRDNPQVPEAVVFDGSCVPAFKRFDRGRGTKVLIHGFGDSVEASLMYPALREAYLNRSDLNVLEVDWSEYSAAPWYLTAARNTDPVGKLVGEMLDAVGAEDSHLVGFSLGAHVAGAAGARARVRRITGLDPAQVLFTTVPPELRLDPSDAELVEVVHTSGGYLGFGSPLGHRDFFPNGGGWPQPGCPLDYLAVCSHRRAYYYFAEGIRRGGGFQGLLCQSYPHFESGACAKERSEKVALEMVNENEDHRLVGKFFLDTNPQEPYGSIQQQND